MFPFFENSIGDRLRDCTSAQENCSDNAELPEAKTRRFLENQRNHLVNSALFRTRPNILYAELGIRDISPSRQFTHRNHQQ
jgi:hypothetical protein